VTRGQRDSIRQTRSNGNRRITIHRSQIRQPGYELRHLRRTTSRYGDEEEDDAGAYPKVFRWYGHLSRFEGWVEMCGHDERSFQ